MRGTRDGRGRGPEGKGIRDGREMDKGREGIGGRGRKGKENGDRPPTIFGLKVALSYIVPVPKPKDCITKALTCEDFRGIAISPIISKLFEYCLKEKTEFFQTNNNQFGFKKDRL